MPVDHDVVAVEVFFERPFYELLRREADRRDDESVEQLLKAYAWLQYENTLNQRYSDLGFNGEIGIPEELYNAAEMRAMLREPEEREWFIREFLFNCIEWDPKFVRVDDE